MRYRIWPNVNHMLQTERWQEDYDHVQEILEDAEEPWDQLYQNAYQKVLSCARQTDWQRLLLPQDYQDIADEAFTRCYAHLERYRGASRFSSWVGGYAKNITRDRCARQQTRLKNRKHLEDLARNQMAGYDPLTILLCNERDQYLWQAFYDLEEVDQEIVKRTVFEHDKPRNIARELQLTRKEVLRRYDNAKTAMRCLFLYYCRHGLQ